ncbi:MAG: triose-phosphate isomerase [Clostridiales bacterium]|nr:triose-phosphate isomerase [Clostridiales bacterium]
MRKPFIAGNWKMFKNMAQAAAFAEEFKKVYSPSDVKVAFCAPYTQLETLVKAFAGTGIGVGAQNMHFEEQGAFTGEISAEMLTEIGVDYVIIGHSERRQYFGETDETVNKKLHKAFEHDLLPIFCVGENLEERESGKAFAVVEEQVKKGLVGLSAEQIEKLTVAYEPVWAIGTGKTATSEQADEMCGFIRKTVAGIYGEETAENLVIQYGGSVKPSNVTELMNMYEIDGALVGGASLKAEDFIQIVNF